MKVRRMPFRAFLCTYIFIRVLGISLHFATKLNTDGCKSLILFHQPLLRMFEKLPLNLLKDTPKVKGSLILKRVKENSYHFAWGLFTMMNNIGGILDFFFTQ